MRSTLRRLLPLGLLLGLVGCMPALRPTVAGTADLQPGQAVVVGRVYLNPPFKTGEQKIAWGIGMDLFTKAYLICGDAPWGDKVLPSDDDTSIMAGSIQTPWNQWFFARFDPQPAYIQMLMYYTDVDAQLTGMHTGVTNYRRAYLGAELKLDLKPGDQVVYIGTLVFSRDEFNRLTGLKVYDDLANAMPEIKRRLGGVQVRKALAQKNF